LSAFKALGMTNGTLLETKRELAKPLQPPLAACIHELWKERKGRKRSGEGDWAQIGNADRLKEECWIKRGLLRGAEGDAHKTMFLVKMPDGTQRMKATKGMTGRWRRVWRPVPERKIKP